MQHNEQLFVKFVPYNEKTLAGIIDKKVKFSTVHEFNDFNEYRYLNNSFGNKSPWSDAANNPKLRKLIQKRIGALDFQNSLVSMIKDRCSETYIDFILKALQTGKLQKLTKLKTILLLAENIAYSSVGILCLSELCVFKDGAAQLMFAHYGDNSKGIGLVYKITNDKNDLLIHKVNYNNKKPPIEGLENRVLNWSKGEYNKNEMKDFLEKSQYWEYEHEHRIFKKPGIKPMPEGIQLSAILYAPRFSGSINTLNSINEKFYDNNLVIQRIYPSSKEYKFTMQTENSTNQCIIKFLEKKLYN